MHHWHNVSIAILAITLCLIIVATSAAFLACTVLRAAPLNRDWRLALSWFMVFPWYGTWFMAVGLAGFGSRGLCLTMVLATVLVGTLHLWRSRRDWQDLLLFSGESNRTAKICGSLMITIWIIYLLNAAHPQLKYDQFNYHLVVAKKLITNGSPFLHNLDQATILAGILEYGYAVFYAILPDDLFLTAASQAAATVTFFPLMLFSFAWIERRTVQRANLLGTFSFSIAVLAMFPEAGLFGMAKPAVWVTAGSMLMFAALALPLSSWIFLHLVVLCLLAAAKTSALLLGLIPICALAVQFRSWPKDLVNHQLNWATMFALTCLGLALFKNGWHSGNPIFPAPNPFFGTSENLVGVSKFFAEIQLAGQSAATRALGPILAFKKAWLVAGTIALAGAGYLMGLGRLPRNRRPFLSLIGFVVVFSVLWPMFYQNDIYVRFVAFYYIALVLLGFYLCIGLDSPKTRRAAALLIVSTSLLFSHLDVMVANIFRLNRRTAESAMRNQHWSYEAAEYLNQRMTANDIVISADPAKVFYRGTLVCTCGGGSTALEHQIVENLRQGLKQPNNRRVTALVRQRGTPGPLQELWGKSAEKGLQHVVLLHSEILLLPDPDQR